MNATICPPYPEHMREGIREAMLIREARLAKSAKLSAQRNAESRKAAALKSESWSKWVRQVDDLLAESRRLTELKFGGRPIHATSRTPRLDRHRERIAELEARLSAPAESPAPTRTPPPRRHWDRETLRAFIEEQEARLAALNRGQVAPSQRVYTIPVIGADGQVVPGAGAGFKWDDRQNGWIAFIPGKV